MTQPYLKDRVCLVTGGTRGIGRAIALHLAQAEAKVVVTYRNNEVAAEETRCLLVAQGADFSVVQFDLTQPNSVSALIALLKERFGRLDALINNAGCTFDGAFVTLNDADYHGVVDTNLVGTLRLCLASLPMLKQSKGTIVNLSSLAGVLGKEGQTVYSATKGGINGLTRMLARHLGRDGVRVNSVAPGFIHTDMVADLPESFYAHIIDSTAVKAMGEPDDVAGAVAFLASKQSSYVTGSILRVDGGCQR